MITLKNISLKDKIKIKLIINVGGKTMAIVVRSKSKISKTILDSYFNKIGDSILESFDVDFLVSLRKMSGIRASKCYPTEFGKRFEYSIEIDEDFANEINDLKNQIKFEHIGLCVVYNPGVLRITIIN
jgi:hypothetical protein